MQLDTWPRSRIKEYNLDTNIVNVRVVKCLAELYAQMSVFTHLTEEEKAALEVYASNLKRFFRDYTLAACLGESRHAFNCSDFAIAFPLATIKRIPVLSQYYYDCFNYNRGDRSELLWNAFMKAGLEYEKVFDFLEAMFTEFIWSRGYGGGNWGFICKVGKELCKETDLIGTLLSLDKIAHLAHAGAAFLSASKHSWCDIPENMMLYFLSFKRHAEPCCWLSYNQWNIGKDNPIRRVIDEKGKEALQSDPKIHECRQYQYWGGECTTYKAQAEYAKKFNEVYKRKGRKLECLRIL